MFPAAAQVLKAETKLDILSMMPDRQEYAAAYLHLPAIL